MLQPTSTVFFLCDIQPKFKQAIYGYDRVIATANKLIKLAKLLGVQVVATTQNARALGPIDPAIELSSLDTLFLGTYDKTLFSMVIPEVQQLLVAQSNISSIVIFGIESHICVLQTALSLAERKLHKVHVVADGVSSCNAFEIPFAFTRLRAEGILVETSESIAFQLMRDASLTNFKAFSQLIKKEMESTKETGEILFEDRCLSKSPL